MHFQKQKIKNDYKFTLRQDYKKLDSIWWTTSQRSEQLKWLNKDLRISVAL